MPTALYVQHVGNRLEAARGDGPRAVEAVLLVVLAIERVPCRPG